MLPPPPSLVSLRCCPWRSSAMRLLPCSTHQPLHGVHHCASDTVSIHTAARSYTAIPVHASFLHRGSHTSLGGGRSPVARADAAAPSSASNNPSPEQCSSSTQREAPNAQDTHRSAATSTATAADARVPPRVSSSAHYPVAATAVPALAPELRVRESPQRTPRVACVRIPRLLVFGGDVVSVTALEALHARMRCIVRAALRSRRLCEHNGSIGTTSETCGRRDADAAGDEVEEAQVNAVVREHLTVVCPALPRGVTPEEAARKFTRQYPVARYCVDNGLPIIPVDHPKSLVKSTLLQEMLSTVPVKTSSGSAASSRNSTGAASQATTGACATTTATVSLFTDRPRRSPLYASLSSHIKSHVLSSTARVQPQGLTASPSSSTVADSPAEEHTWAAEGRPLDDYDLVVVVSFRYFLPQKLLRVLPPVINMHPSLLPRYRGASPIFSALRNNETVGGVSIIQMKPEQKAMDSGSVLWQCEVPITPDMDIRLYFPLVTQIGAAGLCDLVFGEAPAPSSPTAASAVDEQKEGGSARWSAAEVSEAVAMAAAATRTGRAAHLSYTPPARVSVSARADLPCVHDGPGGDGGTRVAASHREGAETDDNADGCTSVPSWVALRRRSLVPVVHRSAHRVNLLHFTHDRERLSPHVERPELSIFSSIITAQTAAKRDGDEHTSAAGAELKGSQVSCAADVPPQRCRHWMSLCRGSTHVTPEAVHAASKAHRALFFQNLETASSSSSSSASPAGRRPRTPVNKKHVSPAAAAEMEISTAMKCAEVFPKSVLSPHCDWPDSFTYSWKFAEGQEYQTFANFKDDPFHAPLLPKDTAVLRFSAYDAMEAFGVWRAFVGGEYFQPSVNATLDKGGSPVRNQLVHRGVRRLLRERAKLQHKNESKTKKERKSGAEVPLVSAQEAATAATAAVGNSAQSVMGDDDGAPVGMVVGSHVELDVFNPAGLQLLVEAENTLRTPCTFTQVTNPALLPQCVREELAEVEGGGSSSSDDACLSSSPSSSCFSHRGGGAGRRVRFYRPPPAIFRSLLSSRASMEAQEAEGHRRRERAARQQERKHRRCCGEESTTASAERDADVPAAASASAAAAAPMTTATTQARCKKEKTGGGRQPEEPAEDEEAPEDYVPDVIAVAPPSEQRRWHIPPGTGYFPVSDETYGAIKCRDGWFVWKEAHMKWSNKAQPAVLIRKGLAMKTGVLYVGLFSEYS